jgi:hypothetical protein
VTTAVLTTPALGSDLAPVTPTKRICNPTPPDYPSCNKEQVRNLAKNNTEDWWSNRRFGKTNNVLNSTNLTNAQIDKVIQATRDNLRAILNKDAAMAVARGKVSSKAAWTTSWRQNTYTLDSFPVAAWVNQMFEGCTQTGTGTFCPGDLDACYDDIGNTTSGWAYLECTPSGVPNSWDNYWQSYTNWVNNPGGQGDTVCKREIFVGALVGAGVQGSRAVFGGPGAMLGAALGGAATGTVGGLITCAAQALADQWNW